MEPLSECLSDVRGASSTSVCLFPKVAIGPSASNTETGNKRCVTQHHSLRADQLGTLQYADSPLLAYLISIAVLPCRGSPKNTPTRPFEWLRCGHATWAQTTKSARLDHVNGIPSL